MKLKISDHVTFHVSYKMFMLNLDSLILMLLIDQLVFFLFVQYFYMSLAWSAKVDALQNAEKASLEVAWWVHRNWVCLWFG